MEKKRGRPRKIIAGTGMAHVIEVQGAEYWKNRPAEDPNKDWADPADWVTGYANSHDHPHRAVLINQLRNLAPESVLEIGCSTGPNIKLMRPFVADDKLAGIDINEDVIVKAKELLPAVDYKIGDLRKLPWADKSFDVVVSDAVLLYVGPQEIDKTLDEIDRVTKRALVLVERDAPKDEVCSHVWGRDYAKLLEKRGFVVEKIKITPEIWPHSKGWQAYGCIFVAVRR